MVHFEVVGRISSWDSRAVDVTRSRDRDLFCAVSQPTVWKTDHCLVSYKKLSDFSQLVAASLIDSVSTLELLFVFRFNFGFVHQGIN